MKKITGLIMLAGFSMLAWGQVNIIDKNNSSTPIYHKDGKIGIGTDAPNGFLHVVGSPQTIISSTTDKNYFQYRWTPAGDQAYVWRAGVDMKFGTANGYNAEGWSEKMRITTDGKVGIGTISPEVKLDILGNVMLNSESASVSKSKVNSSILIFRSSGFNGRARYQSWKIFSVANSTWGSGDLVFDSNTDGMGDNERVRFCSNGNVAIGKNTANAKLDVAGNIKAHEIEVTLAAMQDLQLNGTLAANNITYTANGNTADFVFEDSYHLRDLSEVEAFIKANKHLPEIPSAAEMEEAGVNLAEMNKLLLKKVEELTLYSIELEKEVKKVRSSESAVRKEMEEKVEGLELKVEELSDEKRAMRGENEKKVLGLEFRVQEQEERLAKMEALLEELSK